jgi:hypothetical protein
MSEKSGTIVFINSHDYLTDITGENWVGCLASLYLGDGQEILLYTESLRLQQNTRNGICHRSNGDGELLGSGTQKRRRARAGRPSDNNA